jgi:hypothetical protein
VLGPPQLDQEIGLRWNNRPAHRGCLKCTET